MFMPSLAFLGKSAPLDPHRVTGPSGQAARPFVLPTLGSMLSGFSAKLLRAALVVVMPFGNSEEPTPPRHLQGMMALLRRANEIESTQPSAAAELRWLAASCYYV